MNRFWLNLGLAVAFGIGVLLLWRYGAEAPPVVTPAQRSDYVLRDFELITLDDEGNESFTVRGPFLQRDRSGKSLSLVRPRFSFPAADGGGRWKARADRAWVSEGGEQVHLMRNVRMTGPESPAGLVTRFRTSRLVVFPDTEEARSDERVTVTQGDSILEGTGLRADMKAKRFTLQNQVKGRYVPR
jgi:lipopolysaccharide export system protein LptC